MGERTRVKAPETVSISDAEMKNNVGREKDGEKLA